MALVQRMLQEEKHVLAAFKRSCPVYGYHGIRGKSYLKHIRPWRKCFEAVARRSRRQSRSLMRLYSAALEEVRQHRQEALQVLCLPPFIKHLDAPLRLGLLP